MLFWRLRAAAVSCAVVPIVIGGKVSKTHGTLTMFTAQRSYVEFCVPRATFLLARSKRISLCHKKR